MSSTFKDIVKNGWHPESKDGIGLKDRLRDDFKGLSQLGRSAAKDKHHNTTEYRASRPIQSLKDPATFGKPPKRNYPASYDSTSQQQVLCDNGHTIETSRGNHVDSQAILKYPPLLPDRTSYKAPKAVLPSQTNHNDLSIPEKRGTSASSNVMPNLPLRLPPRLPMRDKPVSPQNPTGSKLDTITKNGISKMKLSSCVDVNTSMKAEIDSSKNQKSSPNSEFAKAQSIFAAPTNTCPGTTLSQKKAALKTISSLRSDPSQISISDAKTTANTVDSFRKRHGDQVKTGLNLARKFNSGDTISKDARSLQSETNANDESQRTIHLKDSLSGKLTQKKPPPVPIKLVDRAGISLTSRKNAPPIPTWTKPKVSLDS